MSWRVLPGLVVLAALSGCTATAPGDYSYSYDGGYPTYDYGYGAPGYVDPGYYSSPGYYSPGYDGGLFFGFGGGRDHDRDHGYRQQGGPYPQPRQGVPQPPPPSAGFRPPPVAPQRPGMAHVEPAPQRPPSFASPNRVAPAPPPRAGGAPPGRPDRPQP